MKRYRYTALSNGRRTVNGFIEADCEQTARSKLLARGEAPTRIKPASANASSQGISRKELAAFLSDLAALHDAGVPLRRALDVLSSGASTAKGARLAQLLGERLDAGVDLSRAAYEGASTDLALSAELIRAGESSGRLGETLTFAAELLRRQADVSSRIASALAYPLFLVALSIGALIALAAFAGPAIAPLLDDTPDASSGLKTILGIGEALRQHGLFILVGLIAAGIVVVFLARRSPAREFLAELRTRLPMLGAIVRDINCGTFARTLGALIAGGAPAASSMELAAATAPNACWRRRLLSSADQLRDGRTIAAALESIHQASPELGRLARVGEASGALGDMLSRAGQIAITRALRRLDQAAAAAGPILILTMGGFTGWLMSTFLSGLSQLGEGAL